MEHFVQFSINFDDETIKKRLEENAYNDIVNRIYDEVYEKVSPEIDRISYRSRGWNNNSSYISTLVNEQVKLLFDKDKDRIIQMAVDKIAGKIGRNTDFKVKCELAKEKLGNEQ